MDALKPKGLVVVEGQGDAFPRNGLLTLFDSLRVLRYEDVLATSDLQGRREMSIVRLVARKPAQ